MQGMILNRSQNPSVAGMNAAKGNSAQRVLTSAQYVPVRRVSHNRSTSAEWSGEQRKGACQCLQSTHAHGASATSNDTHSNAASFNQRSTSSESITIAASGNGAALSRQQAPFAAVGSLLERLGSTAAAAALSTVVCMAPMLPWPLSLQAVHAEVGWVELCIHQPLHLAWVVIKHAVRLP